MTKVGKVKIEFPSKDKVKTVFDIQRDEYGDFNIEGEYSSSKLTDTLLAMSTEGLNVRVIEKSEVIGDIEIENDSCEHEMSGFAKKSTYQVFEYRNKVHVIDDDDYVWERNTTDELIDILGSSEVEATFCKHSLEKVGLLIIEKGDFSPYLKEAYYYIHYSSSERYTVYDDDSDIYFSQETLKELHEEIKGIGRIVKTSKSISEFLKDQLIEEDIKVEKIVADAPFGLDLPETTVPTKIEEENVTNIALNNKNTGVDLKMENKTMGNIFGVVNGRVELKGIQLDENGKIGVNKQFVNDRGNVEELGREVEGMPIVMIGRGTQLSKIQIGDLVKDPQTGKPVFVTHEPKGNQIDIRCMIENGGYTRSVVKNPIMGEPLIEKYDSLFTLIGSEKLQELMPLMGYGEDRVINLVIQQIIRSGDVSISQVEMELDPSRANIQLTQTIEKLVSNMGGTGNNVEERLKAMEEKIAEFTKPVAE